jgi:hypothetical protein
MKAEYRHKDGTWGKMEHEVIKPQSATHTDAFTLLAFESWEDVVEEKLIAAVTDVLEFKITNKQKEIGFHGNQD